MSSRRSAPGENEDEERGTKMREVLLEKMLREAQRRGEREREMKSSNGRVYRRKVAPGTLHQDSGEGEERELYGRKRAAKEQKGGGDKKAVTRRACGGEEGAEG